MRKLEKAVRHYGSKAVREKTAKHKAFTLAEVLITIAIIGIVAAITLPNLMTNINQRKYNSASSNFQRKFGEALKIMSAQNTLKGHSTTLSFVNELGKNFKIVKICKTVTDCFPEKFVNSSNTVIETSTLTDAQALGQEYETETIGVQFVNGVRAIIAYNPLYTLQSNGEPIIFDKDDKLVSMRTNVVAMVFDVSEDDNNKINEDIFSKNTNFGNSGPCVQIGAYCVKDYGKDYTALACYPGVNTDYCGTRPSEWSNDFWAGAQKKCKDEGMKLPSQDELTRIWQLSLDLNNAGLIASKTYWSSSERSDTTNKIMAFSLNFSSGYMGANTDNNKNVQNNVLCIDN